MCEFCENHWKKISQLFIDEVFIIQSAKYARMGDNEELPIEGNPGSTEFIHPGRSIGSPKITLWSSLRNKTVIPFDDIVDLIIQSDAPIDERSGEEFLEAFAELMS